MKKLAKVLSRYLFPDPSALLHALEVTNKRVHIARRTSGLVYTLRGVPGRHIDIVVTDDVREPRDPRDLVVLEVVEKQGKYDGQYRMRLLVRRMHGHAARDFELVDVSVDFQPESALLVVGNQQFTFPRLRETLEGYDYLRIVLWHWRRYFTHLTEADGVREVAQAFVPSDGATLAEANRQASCALYALSREAGWRKLTMRERERLGHSDSAQWQRISTIEEWHSQTGCGEYTLQSARPKH